jgi:hypothetical protein
LILGFAFELHFLKNPECPEGASWYSQELALLSR